ncbi:hypothetical protein bAD24_III04820 [Burkholderia sp. AD24]|nr:hypothetical protein bAD24_III04820 [Burkholderia sp. AD24]
MLSFNDILIFMRERAAKRQELRLAGEVNRSNIATLERAYATTLTELRQVFEGLPDNLYNARLPSYPGARHLGELGINAVLQSQLIETTLLPDFIRILQEDHQQIGDRHYSRTSSRVGSGGDIYVSAEPQFSGQLIKVLTNEVDVLHKLAAANFNPPLPWTLFPELGLPIRVSQGDAQYWYENIWDPYWHSLSTTEQDKFMRDKQPSPEWEEALRWREPPAP